MFVKAVHIISVIVVFPKLGHLQKDMQSKSTWKKKMFRVHQSFGELWSLSPCHLAELKSQGSNFRKDVLPIPSCRWRWISKPLIYILIHWSLEKKEKSSFNVRSYFFDNNLWKISVKGKKWSKQEWKSKIYFHLQ